MYRDFYGLAGCPSQPAPDPACYFESQSHRHALSYLGCAMAQGEGFVVVTGEAGAGKSTLVAQLVASIDPVGLTTAQLVCGQFKGEDVIEVIAGAFGLATNTRYLGDIGTIEFFLHEEARAGRRCLLIVDEAQVLSIEMLEQLRLLSDLQLGAHSLLQILLIGQPKFRSRLKRHPALKQFRLRVLASHHLAPLESVEVEGYVRHRLEYVGWNGRPSFDPGVYAGIHAASGGLPRRINQIVDRMLLLGASSQKERIDGEMVTQVLAEPGAEGGVQPAGPVSAADRPSVRAEPLSGTAHGIAAPSASSIFAAAPASGAPRQSDAHPGEPFRLTDCAQDTRDDALARSVEEIRALHQAALHLATTSQHPRRVARFCMDSPRVELSPADLALLLEQLAALEHRVIEQERTIHHTMSMVIDWIERDAARDIAA